jgi:HEAT repeat protein/beta-lactamase regulating signal transducer with metallopeptidase domain
MTAADALAWLMTYALHSTLLLGGVWLLTSRGPVRSHHLRDLYWKAALVGGVVTATGQVLLRQVDWAGAFQARAAREGIVVSAVALPMPMPMPLGRRPAQPDGATEPAVAAPTPRVSLSTILFLAWGGLAALALGGLAAAHRRLARRLGRREDVRDYAVLSLLDSLRSDAGMRRVVRLTQSDGLASPIALGRSEICVPRAVLSDLDAAQQRSVLAHELAHLARRDPLWLTGASLLERLFFFQPLNRLARRRIQESAEYLCDDWAVGRTGSGLTMAKSLMKVAEWMHTEPSPVPLAGMAENPSHLVSRVKRLVEHRGSVEARRVWPVPLACGLLLVTAAAVPGVTAYGSEETPAFVERSATGQEFGQRQDPGAEPGIQVDEKDMPEPEPMPSADTNGESLEGAAAGADLEFAVAGKESETAHDTLGLAALIAALRDSDAGVRRAAAQSLGNIESPRAVDGLIGVLRDSDVEVRRAAVWALGEIEDPRAVDALVPMLKDPDPEVRKSAAWALGNIEDPRAADGLAGALSDESVEVRKTAAWALGELELTAAPAGLIEAMRDSDPEVRKSAVWSVGQMGDARAVPALRDMLADASAEVRSSAIEALGEIRNADALQALIDAMKSNDPEIRRAAAEALGDR